MSEISAKGLEKYRKLLKLGEGTYGVVYKAIDLETEEFVALKKIRIDDEEEGIPSTAVREIALLKEIRHPNVVELSNVIFHHSQLYLVFPFLQNDLKKHLDANKRRLSLDTIKSYIHQLLLGLEHCHRNRILHRDLKPQNILVSKDGELKLADFGLARTYTLPNRTWTHEVITLWYRPPEILLGCKVYGMEVDIWSLGCIFAELCNGNPLFHGDSQICQIMHIFKILGTPNNATWNSVSSLKDFQVHFPKWKSQKFDQIVSNLCDLGRDLLSRMLVLNPYERISAKQALSHPYFHDLDQPTNTLHLQNVI